MIYYANVDLGYEDNEFNVLGGNVDDYLSLCYFRGYDPSINPYCICLGDLTRKITSTIFFNHSYDFSKAIDKVRRTLILFGVILVIAFYLVFSKLLSQGFDKLYVFLRHLICCLKS